MSPPAHRHKAAKSSKERKRHRPPAAKTGKGDPEEIKGGGAPKMEPAVADYFHRAHETFRSGFASDEEKRILGLEAPTSSTRQGGQTLFSEHWKHRKDNLQLLLTLTTVVAFQPSRDQNLGDWPVQAVLDLRPQLSPQCPLLGLFVSNVLTEAVAVPLPLALDPSGSLLLQELLPWASGASLEPLLGALLPSLRLVACHPCGAHILEGALWRALALISDGAEGSQALEEQVLALGKGLQEELPTFAVDAHASFVVRTLLQVLGGSRVGSDGGRAIPGSGLLHPRVKSSKVGSKGPEVFEVPPSFLSLLQEFKGCFQEQIADFITNKCFGLCLQVALVVLHRKLPETSAELCRFVIGYLSSRNPAAGQSSLLVFLKDPTCSRILDKVLEVSDAKALRSFYKAHVKGQLRALSAHKVANFTLQRLIHAASRKLLGKLFQELAPGLEEILALEHLGIVTALLGACRKHRAHQPEMLRILLEAFHCWEPPARQLACAPLLASVLAYEVYFGEEEEKADTPPALSTVSYHGSMMLQHLLYFTNPSLVLDSLGAMPPADLVTLACDPTGSHVFNALLASPSVPKKSRRKILHQLKGHFLSLACSKHGSRVLDAIWRKASLPAKRELAQELAEHEARLRHDPFGHHLVRNFALTHFVKRRRDWDGLQQAEKKRRRLFAEILED